jgi:MFS transporter, YNFM family, putative membrane transport protein
MHALPSALSVLPDAIPHSPIRAGTPEFRRTSRALFLGGFSTFALLYCVQPLMPQFSMEFHLTPSQSSWSLSASTVTLAAMLLFASALSNRIGRKMPMCCALLLSALLTVLSAFVRNYEQLLVLRVLLGLSLAGLPAVAMAYLSEEIDAPSLGYSMGLYISGSAFGGMSGRLLAATLSDFMSWRIALGVLGIAGLAAAIEFYRSLPDSQNFRPRPIHPAQVLQAIRKHCQDDGLPWLFALAFLMMGCFVSVYNYISYRLLAAPFELRQSVVGAVSLLYLTGIFSSIWAGSLADKFGRRRVLWAVTGIMLGGLLLTLADWLPLIVVGITLFTFGFFGGHSVASSWVGRRARAPQALASALYLFFYYLGSSMLGSFSGWMWAQAGWHGVVALLTLLLLVSQAIAIRLRRLAPL